MSDWGLDPVFRGPKLNDAAFVASGYGGLPSPHPRIEDFAARVANGNGSHDRGEPNVSVNVAGHDVDYDERARPLVLGHPDRHRQGVHADDPARARPLPAGFGGRAELSRIVLADVMSLDPARIAVVVRGGPGL